MTFNEYRMLRELIIDNHRAVMERIDGLKGEIKAMASSTGTGLANLQQADADLAAAITDNTTATQTAVEEIQTLISEAGEDATVASIAADLETKLSIIKANSAALAGAVPATPATPAPAGN